MRTRLIGRSEFAHMKPEAVLINVARGPIVDEDALYEALANRTIRGAVLDVWYRYPEPRDAALRPSRHPFHHLDNVVMTPHCSGWTEGLMERRFAVIIDNIQRLRDGRPLLNQVHPAGRIGPAAESQNEIPGTDRIDLAMVKPPVGL